MTCPIFLAVWTNTDRSAEYLSEKHAYNSGEFGTENSSPTFPRIEFYLASEPPRDIDKKTVCRCGSADAWQCWQDVKTQVILGTVSRSGRGYTVYPEDPLINAAIIGTAGRFFPFVVGSDGLPPEPVRDLCAHLRLEGLYTFADGTVSTMHLRTEAAAYLRRTGTATTINHSLSHERQGK